MPPTPSRSTPLTSGGDTATYPGRELPKNWTLLGSNDGESWTTLDTRTNQADTANSDTRTYAIANTTAYMYYRLNITASNGDGVLQISEAAPTGTRRRDARFAGRIQLLDLQRRSSLQ